MKPVTKDVPATPTPNPYRPARPVEPPPKEPAEVVGRHKNTGQKDHKGAR